MIVDVHTHLSTREQWGPVFCEVVDQAYDGSGMDLDCTAERHQAAMSAVDRAIVFGINSKALQMCTPNDDIAAYARAHSDKIIGFMSIDPNEPGALEEIDRSAGDLDLKGIKMSPVYQNYDPRGPEAARPSPGGGTGVADPHSRSLTLHPQHPYGVGQPASL